MVMGKLRQAAAFVTLMLAVAVALVAAPVTAREQAATDTRSVEFLGQAILPTGFMYAGTQVGGLSGLVYDAENDVYYSISDDRSQFNPARFYTLDIALQDGVLSNGDISFSAVTSLRRADGSTYPALSLDPEGIALTRLGTLLISSEGDANQLINPFINEYALDGALLSSLPVSSKYFPVASRTRGIRNNLAFESATTSRTDRYFFSATENALYQDGPAADLVNGSPARIVRYDLLSGKADREFVYEVEPVIDQPVPAGSFATNGLVELLAFGPDSLLALERSFSTGVGNRIRLYAISLHDATNVIGIDSLSSYTGSVVPAEKTLLLDLDVLGITLDNVEAMTFGPNLPDGRRTLILASDNNFSATQFTQFLAFAID